jgi:hypothetical protein
MNSMNEINVRYDLLKIREPILIKMTSANTHTILGNGEPLLELTFTIDELTELAQMVQK